MAKKTGAAAQPSGSYFSLDQDNIVIEALKLAEDGSGDLILRLYEAMRTATRCTLRAHLPIQAAAQTNMLEEVQHQLESSAHELHLDFRPFEIKTLRLRL